MPTTTKMGIVYPSSTDLVKDGATAMGTISTTVDAKSGLVLLETQTFSAVSAVNFTSKFSSNFDNYIAEINCTFSASLDIYARLRSGSTDASGSDYVTQGVGSNSTSVSAGRTTTTYWFCNFIATGTEFSQTWKLFNPFKASVTNVISNSYSSTGATVAQNACVQRHNLTTSYDGITFYPGGAGTMTGVISLYGINK